MGSASKSSSGASRAFGKLAKAGVLAGAALGAGVVVGVKKSIDAASNLNEQVNKTNVVFRGSQDQVLKWSKGLERSFGLSQRAALEAAGTFGNMLVPMGFARKSAGEMSEKMVELAGDMASFNNASPEDTLLAIRSGLAGEAEPLRKYGVFLSEARVQQEALTETGKKNVKQLTDQEKAVARYNLILKDTKDTQGDFARSAGESMANQMRILKAEFEDAAAAIGVALLPAVIKLMGLVGEIVPVIADFGTRLTKAVAPSVVAAVEGIRPAFENVKNGLQDLLDVARQVYPTLQQIASTSFGFAVSSWGQSLGVATIAMLGFHAAMVRVIAAFTALRAVGAAAAITALINPLTLATVAVGLMAGLLYKMKIDADYAAAGLDRTRAALEALTDAANASINAHQRRTEANIAERQSELNVATALKARTQLEQEGKRGTDEYKQAQLNVQAAYVARKRASIEVSDAQRGVTDSTRQGTEAIRKLWKEADTADESFKKVKGGLFGLISPFRAVESNVKGYVQEMNKLAKEADNVAKGHEKSNPRIAQSAREFAASARAAADYAKRTGEIPGKLSEVAPAAAQAGRRVGISFGQGLQGGILGQVPAIAAAAAKAVVAAENAARSAAQAKSPSKTWQKLGEDMQQGLIIGFITRGTTFSQMAAAHLSTALKEARGAFIEASRVLGRSGAMAIVDGFRTHEQSLAQQIKAALVQATKDALEKAHQAVLDAKSVFASAFDQLASTALEAFDKVSQKLTPTEKKIRREDEQRAAADRQRALDEANKALAKAQAAQGAVVQREGETPEEFAQRQQDAADAVTEAYRQQADALFAIQRAKDEKAAEQERKQYEARTERRRTHFKNEMDDLERQLEMGQISARKFRAKLLALFDRFDVPFQTAGRVLGAALGSGLHDAFADAAKAAGDVIEAMAKELKKRKFVITVDVEQGGGKTEKRQHGGPVRAGNPYIVGEAGPELFIPSRSGMIAPAMAGGGGGMAEIHTHISLDGKQVAEVVRREYLRFQLRNGRAAI